MICFKILIFVTTDTTALSFNADGTRLWFALKFLSLLLQIQRFAMKAGHYLVVICFKILIFVTTDTTISAEKIAKTLLWFALKFLSLLLQIQRRACQPHSVLVVICFKILIFVTTDTTSEIWLPPRAPLWFALKFLSLLLQIQQSDWGLTARMSCDLL